LLVFCVIGGKKTKLDGQTESGLTILFYTIRYCVKDKTKNKLMSVISSVQSHYHEGSPAGKEVDLRWKGFVEKVDFEPEVKE